MSSRRDFLRSAIAAGGAVLLGPGVSFGGRGPSRPPVTAETTTTVFRSVNGTPPENLEKALALAGGIERFAGTDDLVVLKPNVQWWNQGAPNLSALNRLVELVFARAGGFRGEVVLAENCHRGASPSASAHSGWARPFERNADLDGIRTMGELGDRLKKRYGRQFTVRHWIDVAAGARRVSGPGDGDGYVYCDGRSGVPLLVCDNGAEGEKHRATVMTYPVFTTDAGTVVDFRNGVWEKGAYTGRPLKLFNIAALNHHSTYGGATSSVKNYMGITDLSGGPDPMNGGRLTENYYNFHSFPFDRWAPGPRPGMLGKAIGTFMATVRRADFNITTAEWVGLSSRVETPVARTRTVLASTDPVALDYHSAKYVLYPNSGISAHDPDNIRSPLRQYLERCAETAGGMLDETHVAVISFDHRKGDAQEDSERGIRGEKVWGSDASSIIKYVLLRLFA